MRPRIAIAALRSEVRVMRPGIARRNGRERLEAVGRDPLRFAGLRVCPPDGKMPGQTAECRAVGFAVIRKVASRHAGQPLRRRIAAQCLRRPLRVRHGHARAAAPCRGQRQNIDPVKGLLPALRGHVQLQRAAEHRCTEAEVHPVNVVRRRMRQQAQQQDRDQHFFHLHHLSGYSAVEVVVLCRKTGCRSNSRNQKSACGG